MKRKTFSRRNPVGGLLVSISVLVGMLCCVAQSIHSQEPECEAFPFGTDELERRVRRWRGLSAFEQWRLVRVIPDRCTYGVELVFEPPRNWSSRRVPYRLFTKLWLQKATAQPKEPTEKHFKSLAKGVRRLLLRAEAHEDVRRFLERFSIQAADIRAPAGQEQLEISFLAQPINSTKAAKCPRLVFSERSEGGAVAYQLPRMDSLPVRREMLRCMELLSLKYPGCRPVWISARLKTAETSNPVFMERQDKQTRQWEFDIELAGKGCPGRFQGAIFLDGPTVGDSVSNPLSGS